MSDDLGDFLKEAARRRKERRDHQEGQKPRPRPIVEEEQAPARELGEGVTEVRQTLSGQSQFSQQQAMGEVEAARYAARERHVDRVGFAERSAAQAKPKPAVRAGLAATPSPMQGAFSQPQAPARASVPPAETDAQALLRLLRSAGGMRQAFLLSEILRPKHVDG